MTTISFAGDGWETNVEAAQKKAAEQNKGLLIEFTGSDWCGPCMQFKKNVLEKEEFLKAASEKFILVELDFPRKKEQPADVKEHNKKYGDMYGLTGFPTIVFTDAKANPVYSIVGGRNLEETLKIVAEADSNRKTVEKLRSNMKNMPAAEKYKQIGQILNRMPLDYIDRFYADFAEELKGDTDDISDVKRKQLLQKQQTESDAFARSISQQGLNSDERQKAYDEYLKKPDLLPEIKQKMASTMSAVYLMEADVDNALAKMQQSIDYLPDSEYAARLKSQKNLIEKDKDNIKARKIEEKKWMDYMRGLPRETMFNPELALPAIQTYLDKNNPAPWMRQRLVAETSTTLMMLGRMDEGLAKMQEAIDINPGGLDNLTENLKLQKAHIEKDVEASRQHYAKQRAMYEEMLKKNQQTK